MKLTKGEKDILYPVEKGGRERIPKTSKQESAITTVRKDKRVDIRMTGGDLFHFQKATIHEGLLYLQVMAARQ